MGLCCLGLEKVDPCLLSTVVGSLLVILFFRWLLAPNYHRPVTRRPKDPKRTTPRGTGVDMKCVSPSTGELIGTIKAYTAADVKSAYEAARVAAKEGPDSWNKTSFEERRAVLQELLDWVVGNQEEIIEMSIRDSGKTGQTHACTHCELNKRNEAERNGANCQQRVFSCQTQSIALFLFSHIFLVTEAAMGEVMFICEKIRWLIQNGQWGNSAKHSMNRCENASFIILILRHDVYMLLCHCLFVFFCL